MQGEPRPRRGKSAAREGEQSELVPGKDEGPRPAAGPRRPASGWTQPWLAQLRRKQTAEPERVTRPRPGGRRSAAMAARAGRHAAAQGPRACQSPARPGQAPRTHLPPPPLLHTEPARAGGGARRLGAGPEPAEAAAPDVLCNIHTTVIPF